MRQVEQLRNLGESEQKRVDNVVEILSSVAMRDEGIAEIAHDARNMVTALDLYCDLLQEPGVLGRPYAHYSGELRLIAAASRRLIEELLSMLQSQLALSQNGVPAVVAEKLRLVADLAGTLREQLSASSLSTKAVGPSLTNR